MYVCMFVRGYVKCSLRKTLTSNNRRNHARARRILRYVNRLRVLSAIWAVYINYNRQHEPTYWPEIADRGPIHTENISYYSTTNTSIHGSKFTQPSTFWTLCVRLIIIYYDYFQDILPRYQFTIVTNLRKKGHLSMSPLMAPEHTHDSPVLLPLQ